MTTYESLGQIIGCQELTTGGWGKVGVTIWHTGNVLDDVRVLYLDQRWFHQSTYVRKGQFSK